MNAETQHTTFVTTRLILGLSALGVSLIYSWEFIAGDSAGLALATAAVFVFVTEISKVLFVSDALFYGACRQSEKAAWTWVIVGTLFVLSISATAYNIVVNSSQSLHTERLQDEQYQAILQRREDNNAALAAAVADKAACPSNYITKCINPAQTRIDAHRATQEQIAAELGAFVPVSGSNAFWAPLGGSGAMLTFAFIRGILLEVIGIILMGQALAGMRIPATPTAAVIQQPSTAAVEAPKIGYCVTPGCKGEWEITAQTAWNKKYCADCRAIQAAPHKNRRTKA